MSDAGMTTGTGIPRAARIRTARDLRAQTQAEVASAMDPPITAAALSLIESGKVQPSRKTLAALADALNVPIGFFFGEWTDSASDDVLGQVTYFRDLAATPAKERRRAGAHALLLNVLIAAIESRVQLPRLDVPEYLADEQVGRDEIDDIAQAIRGEWNLGDDPIPNVVRAVERHGVAVARMSLGGQRVDAFSVRFPGRPLIVLTDDKSNYVRSRFDVSHELGHLVMHRLADASDRSIEDQAHDFAASFLMPAPVAIELLPRKVDSRAWTSLAGLKREWGISIAALLYRARDLRLLSADAYRNAMKYMSVRGWRKAEPGDREMGLPETPSLFQRAIETITIERGESLDDLAFDAQLPADDLRWLVRAVQDRRPYVEL